MLSRLAASQLTTRSLSNAFKATRTAPLRSCGSGLNQRALLRRSRGLSQGAAGSAAGEPATGTAASEQAAGAAPAQQTAWWQRVDWSCVGQTIAKASAATVVVSAVALLASRPVAERLTARELRKEKPKPEARPGLPLESNFGHLSQLESAFSSAVHNGHLLLVDAVSGTGVSSELKRQLARFSYHPTVYVSLRDINAQGQVEALYDQLLSCSSESVPSVYAHSRTRSEVFNYLGFDREQSVRRAFKSASESGMFNKQRVLVVIDHAEAALSSDGVQTDLKALASFGRLLTLLAEATEAGDIAPVLCFKDAPNKVAHVHACARVLFA